MNLTPDQKLVESYCSKFEACSRARRKYEQEWYTNLAFYFGKHYVQWTRSATGLNTSMVIPAAAPWRVRLIINRLKPVIRKEIAKINKERPIFDVLPSSPDDEDIAKARTGKAIADLLLGGSEFHQARRQMIFWAATTGTGFKKVHMKSEEDIEYIAPTPFHLWVPNLEEPNIQRQPFVTHGVSQDPSYLKAKWGVDLDPDEGIENSHQKFLTSIGVERKSSEIGEVFTKEFWVKPCSDFPDGAFFVIANKQLLYMQEGIPEIEIDPVTGDELKDPEGNAIPKKRIPSNVLMGDAPTSKFPYKHGRYPFVKLDHGSTGRFYGESTLVDLIPVQREYNRSRSQTVEARNLTSKPQYVVPKGSVDVTKLVSRPGLVIEFTPGFDPPKALEQPELPSYVFQDQDRSISDMDYISNQFEVTQGRAPAGVEAASAIAYLQEENDSILGPTIDSLEEAVEDIGYQSLELAKQYWPDEKMVKVVSGSQVYEVFQFKRNSLPDEIDFKVERGSMQPKSSAAQRAFIMELVNSGAIPPIEGLKYLDMGITGKLYEDLQVDVRQVERENFKMKNSMTIEINEFDNDEIHAVSHAKFMKTQSYESLEEPVKAIFMQHYMQHMIRLGRINAGTGDTESGGEPAPSGTESGSGTSQPVP